MESSSWIVCDCFSSFMFNLICFVLESFILWFRSFKGKSIEFMQLESNFWEVVTVCLKLLLLYFGWNFVVMVFVYLGLWWYSFLLFWQILMSPQWDAQSVLWPTCLEMIIYAAYIRNCWYIQSCMLNLWGLKLFLIAIWFRLTKFIKLKFNF